MKETFYFNFLILTKNQILNVLLIIVNFVYLNSINIKILKILFVLNVNKLVIV